MKPSFLYVCECLGVAVGLGTTPWLPSPNSVTPGASAGHPACQHSRPRRCLCQRPTNRLPFGPSQPVRDCTEVMDEVLSRRCDSTGQPLTDLGVEYSTDGCGFVRGGERLAGCAVGTLHSTTEAKPLPRGPSARKAELTAGVRANTHRLRAATCTEPCTGRRASLVQGDKT